MRHSAHTAVSLSRARRILGVITRRWPAPPRLQAWPAEMLLVTIARTARTPAGALDNCVMVRVPAALGPSLPPVGTQVAIQCNIAQERYPGQPEICAHASFILASDIQAVASPGS